MISRKHDKFWNRNSLETVKEQYKICFFLKEYTAMRMLQHVVLSTQYKERIFQTKHADKKSINLLRSVSKINIYFKTNKKKIK